MSRIETDKSLGRHRAFDAFVPDLCTALLPQVPWFLKTAHQNALVAYGL